jgi:hypothetical protein
MYKAAKVIVVKAYLVTQGVTVMQNAHNLTIAVMISKFIVLMQQLVQHLPLPQRIPLQLEHDLRAQIKTVLYLALHLLWRRGRHHGIMLQVQMRQTQVPRSLTQEVEIHHQILLVCLRQ